MACVLALSTLAALGQAPAGSSQAPEGAEVVSHEVQPTFRIRAERNLVMVRAVVRQQNGKAVGNLRKEDFQVFDNGKPQTITGFSVEAVGAAPEAARAPAPEKAQPPAPPEIQPPAALPRRFVALFFDDLHLRLEDVQRTRDAAIRFMASSLQPSDRAGIFSASGQLTQDFTRDRNALRAALSRLQPRGKELREPNACPDIWDYQAFLIGERRDQAAFGIAVRETIVCKCPKDIRNTPQCINMATEYARSVVDQVWNLEEVQGRESLDSLDGLVRRVAFLPGQRTVVLVSPGFLFASGARRALDNIIERALGAGTTISSIDARGLYMESGPSQGSPESPLDFTGHPEMAAEKVRMEDSGLIFKTDVLNELAEATGGTFFHNSNDMDEGLRATAAAPEVSYLLSFSPTDLKPNGDFHNLKVKLANGGPYTIEARRGYFAPQKDQQGNLQQNDPIQNLIFSQEELHGLPVDFHAEVSKASGDKAKLSIISQVDAGQLQFRKENGRNVNTLSFYTLVFDRDGKYVTGSERSLELHLKDDTLARLSQHGFTARTDLQVPLDVFTVRQVVSDTVAGAVSAIDHPVDIPSSLKPKAPEVVPQPGRRAGEVTLLKPHEPRALTYAPDVTSVVNWPLPELFKAIPELKGLEPAETQEDLPAILEKVGENVKAYFEDFPNTASVEGITMERLGRLPQFSESGAQKFQYLALAKPSEGCSGLNEYRTNQKGERLEPQGLAGSYFITQGFVSTPLHFHPSCQADSAFRYLGRQVINKRQTYVVAFAQRPEVARQAVRIHIEQISLLALVQGIAWIDSSTYRILRMRTDLLPAREEIGPTRVTTKIEFQDVHFKESPQALWLPREVVVSTDLHRYTYLNQHRYSNFKLFSVGTEEKVEAPHSAPPSPPRP
jgi:VWFA-related protein